MVCQSMFDVVEWLSDPKTSHNPYQMIRIGRFQARTSDLLLFKVP